MFLVSWEDSDWINKSVKGGSSESTCGLSKPLSGVESPYSRSVSDDCVQPSELYIGSSDLVINVEA